MGHRLKIENIRAAVGVIDPVFLNTPQYVAESLSQVLGVRLVVKIETANPVRCFKGRGAEYFVSKLRRGDTLITASAGNLGQAMAYACRRRGVALTVYASTRANPFKIERMRALGAEVVLFGKDFDDAKLEARRQATRPGVRLVEDSLDVETGEGAGTIGLELAAFPERLDAVVMALGNGALLCGVGVAVKHTSPQTRIVAVQAAGAPAMIESWRQGKVITHDSVATIADGIAIRLPFPECVEDMRGIVDEGVFVQEQSLVEAIRLAHQHLGLVLEPSGAAGLAALLEHRELLAGKTVAVVLCGGNLTPEQMREWLG
jgi:threonine dehydratase